MNGPDLMLAVGIAGAFTILICLIEIPRRAKTGVRACLGWAFLTYLLIFLIGNTFSTLLASPILEARLPAALSGWLPFFVAFGGVFAFHAVLANTNVTFFGNAVLTIEDWIARARAHAVEAAIRKQIALDETTALEVADDLKGLPEERLNAYLAQFLGPDVVADLEAHARNANAEPALYKALALAYGEPEKARAVARQAGREPGPAAPTV